MVLSYAWPRWSAADLASSSLIPLSRQELLNLGLDVSLSELGYRQLVVNWDSTLVVCSFVVSFLGAYSASQVCCQANVSSKSTWHFYAWNGLAGMVLPVYVACVCLRSLCVLRIQPFCSDYAAFGHVGFPHTEYARVPARPLMPHIVHFLAMLAAQFPVDVSLSPGLTAFSAFIAVLFTWIALVSDSFASKYLRKQRRKTARSDNRRGRQRTGHTKGSTSEASKAARPTDIEAQPLLDADDTISDLESAVHTSSSHRSRSHGPQDIEASDRPSGRTSHRPGGYSALNAVDDDGVYSPAEEPVTDMKRNLNETSHLMAVAMEDAKAPPGDVGPSLQRVVDEEYSATKASQQSHDEPFSPPLRLNDINTPFAARLQYSGHGIMMSRENSVVEEGHPERPDSAPLPTRSRRFSFPFFARKRPSGTSPLHNDAANESNTDLTYSDGNTTPRLSSSSTSPFTETSGMPDTYSSRSSSNTSIAKHLPLTRREKLRLKAGGAISHVSLRELLLTLWGDCNREACAKAFVWSSAV